MDGAMAYCDCLFMKLLNISNTKAVIIKHRKLYLGKQIESRIRGSPLFQEEV